jgi:hypothetical protein
MNDEDYDLLSDRIKYLEEKHDMIRDLIDCVIKIKNNGRDIIDTKLEDTLRYLKNNF